MLLILHFMSYRVTAKNLGSNTVIEDTRKTFTIWNDTQNYTIPCENIGSITYSQTIRIEYKCTFKENSSYAWTETVYYPQEGMSFNCILHLIIKIFYSL